VSNFKDHNYLEKEKIKESPVNEVKQSPDENNYNVSPASSTNLDNNSTMPVPGSVGVQGQNATQGE
jgi:hypothetical protein